MPALLPALDPGTLMWLGLGFLFLISFVGTIPFPLPITLTVVWLAQFHFPVAVILTSTIGSLLGWVCFENVMRRWILQRPRLQNAIPPIYQKFFLRRTGLWLFLFNALPFPFDPIRFLALLNDYPRSRFLWVMGAARIIRNTILVTLGLLLAPYKVWFWLAMVALLVLPLLIEKAVQLWLRRLPTLPDA